MRNVVFIENRISSGGREISPYEYIHGVPARVNHIRVFGSKVFAYKFDVQRNQLDDKATVGILVGYEGESAAYRIFVPTERRVIRSGHVICEKERAEERDNEDYNFLEEPIHPSE